MILKMIKILVIISLLKSMNNTYYMSGTPMNSCEERISDTLFENWSPAATFECQQPLTVSGFVDIDNEFEVTHNGSPLTVNFGMIELVNTGSRSCFLIADLPDWPNPSVNIDEMGNVIIKPDALSLSAGAHAILPDSSEIYLTKCKIDN